MTCSTIFSVIALQRSDTFPEYNLIQMILKVVAYLGTGHSIVLFKGKICIIFTCVDSSLCDICQSFKLLYLLVHSIRNHLDSTKSWLLYFNCILVVI